MTGSPNSIELIDLRDGVDHQSTIGGKAAGLVTLARLGFPVPQGVIVPAEATESDIEPLAAIIADRFSPAPVAVRSSGVAEDLADASYAGQYETVLGVSPDGPSITEAIRRVRSSADEGGLPIYHAPRSQGMAVLVMPMIEATSAGVAFTRDPVSGDRVVVVEAVHGLGDKLAAGEIMGERWVVDGSANRQDDKGVLTHDQAGSVAELALACERAMGGPQDIEWAFDGDRLVLLQSRPITTVDDIDPIPMDGTPPPGPWEWDSTHNRVPMTVLTSSVFIPGFESGSRRLADTFGAPIEQLSMRSINGYLYVQVVPLAGKPGASAPPKFVMRSLFAVLPSLRRKVAAARKAFETRVDRQLVEQWRTQVGPGITATIERWQEADETALSDADLADLLEEAADLQRETFAWNMATDPAYLLPLSVLNEFISEHLGRGIGTSIRLLAGSSPSAYQKSVQHLHAVLTDAGKRAITRSQDGLFEVLSSVDPGFMEAYEAHTRIHGLGMLGFDLSNRTVGEDPEQELGRIATLPAAVDASIGSIELAAELREELTPALARRLDELIDEARRTYPIREEGEAVHSRVMGNLRMYALEAGARMNRSGVIDTAEDVFHLSLSELTAWLRTRGDVTDLVRRRRAEYVWAKGYSPPPLFGDRVLMPPIEIFPPDIQRVMRMLELVTTHDMSPATLDEGADGVAASSGMHTGPACIVMDSDDFAKVRTGDVLIAPITTSPWEVLFPHIGALVTEGGGLLSHPAIVAREYGLPAVVGCVGATERFHDGQIIVVDGTAGTVSVVE